MKKISIIGAGQLGSRHLQALMLIDFDVELEIVEPFKASRETAQQRAAEMPANGHIKSLSFLTKIDELSDELDLVIIATGADIRCQLTKDLLSQKQVKNLVLEKVLFQTINEYDVISDLLQQTGF